MSITLFNRKKRAQEKIVMVTCYDAASAAIVEQSAIDSILVGDSVAMAVHGLPNTTHATMEMMLLHTQSVARAIQSKFIVADMPFLSYRQDLSHTMKNVQALIQAGAHAIKIEGCKGNIDLIKHIVDSGVPVMGHLGLTPQAIHQIGGNKVQGRTEQLAKALIDQAYQLQQAGVFALVLECIPQQVSATISQNLEIPTIGIGAGVETDGQILVYHDLLGLQTDFQPKFLKQYFDAQPAFLNALNSYAQEVKTQTFPAKEHCYQ